MTKTAARVYLDGITGVVVKEHRIVRDADGLVSTEEFLVVAPKMSIDLIRGEGYFAQVSGRSGISEDTYHLVRRVGDKSF